MTRTGPPCPLRQWAASCCAGQPAQSAGLVLARSVCSRPAGVGTTGRQVPRAAQGMSWHRSEKGDFIILWAHCEQHDDSCRHLSSVSCVPVIPRGTQIQSLQCWEDRKSPWDVRKWRQAYKQHYLMLQKKMTSHSGQVPLRSCGGCASYPSIAQKNKWGSNYSPYQHTFPLHTPVPPAASEPFPFVLLCLVSGQCVKGVVS